MPLENGLKYHAQIINKMGLIKKAIFGMMVLLLVYTVVADVDWEDPFSSYGTPLTPMEFQALTSEELSDWDIEYRGYEETNQDIIYYFYMNSYYYFTDENDQEWIVPSRETREVQCFEDLDCDEFYVNQVNFIINNELNYLEGLQNEL
jgi:hypothetical protein